MPVELHYSACEHAVAYASLRELIRAIRGQRRVRLMSNGKTVGYRLIDSCAECKAKESAAYKTALDVHYAKNGRGWFRPYYGSPRPDPATIKKIEALEVGGCIHTALGLKGNDLIAEWAKQQGDKYTTKYYQSGYGLTVTRVA